MVHFKRVIVCYLTHCKQQVILSHFVLLLICAQFFFQGADSEDENIDWDSEDEREIEGIRPNLTSGSAMAPVRAIVIPREVMQTICTLVLTAVG